ncbi:Sec14p-like phosphatidylinositol transfer family protein [Actinidia rufa]|uniref:Sec14p-like phosphatidylinositol transfer family protein n=1 Tax=Actinidia rufa TaxID=165716 RepID=A0A7J0H3D3_9ERIC|nr:Sec14p-like phosphatidylinositol transfer family protein [Actinidia rufa]
MIRRFLRARDLDIGRASAMFLKYLKWRRTFVPNGFVSASEIPNEIKQNKMFIQGSDKQGRVIAVAFAGRHFPIKGGLDEVKRFVVFSLDKICSRMPTGQEKFAVIGDLEGWGYKSSDIRAYLGALTILQIVFVENKKLRSTLLEDIDESQLPEIYGGKLPLVPIQDS